MVAFGAVDCTADQELCANYDVRGYPTIKYFNFYDKAVKEYTGGRKEGDFVNFIHSQADFHPTAQKELTAQQSGFGLNVMMTSDVDFEQVMNSPTPSFIMFFASWCSHCVEAKPQLNLLADKLKAEDININVYAVDAAKNPKVADLAGIQTLPTFKLYTSGQLISVYDGGRNMDEMFEFCRQYAKVKDEL